MGLKSVISKYTWNICWKICDINKNCIGNNSTRKARLAPLLIISCYISSNTPQVDEQFRQEIIENLEWIVALKLVSNIVIRYHWVQFRNQILICSPDLIFVLNFKHKNKKYNYCIRKSGLVYCPIKNLVLLTSTNPFDT